MDGYRVQIVKQCDVGLSRHSKTHSLYHTAYKHTLGFKLVTCTFSTIPIAISLFNSENISFTCLLPFFICFQSMFTTYMSVAYPGGVLRVLEHPPKRFLLGVAIGFIPLQTTSLNIQSSFTQLHRLRGKKATRCHTSLRLSHRRGLKVGVAWPDCASACGLAPPSLNFWIRQCMLSLQHHH